MAVAVRRVYRRLRFGSPIVVVSGVPRSGTSMLMRMLAAGGMAVMADESRAADEDNPRGYFEDSRVHELHRSADRTWLRQARGKAIKIISFHLEHLPPGNFYMVLFLERDLGEVIASQNAMLRRRGEPVPTSDEETRALLQRHIHKVLLTVAGLPFVEVHRLSHRAVIDDPRRVARQLCDVVGQQLDEHAMAAAVDPTLYRNRGVRW